MVLIFLFAWLKILDLELLKMALGKNFLVQTLKKIYFDQKRNCTLLYFEWRPRSDCIYCTNVTQIEIFEAEKLKEDIFVQYAYSGRPFLVKNAAKNWKALDVFTFEFFRDLRPKDCQFFPYKRKETQYFQALKVNITWKDCTLEEVLIK